MRYRPTASRTSALISVKLVPQPDTSQHCKNTDTGYCVTRCIQNHRNTRSRAPKQYPVVTTGTYKTCIVKLDYYRLPVVVIVHVF